MNLEGLKKTAASLPLAPGVYIMKDSEDVVIYVGKAKILRNRVSQYFQESASHTLKTRAMVAKIDHFDVIVAASEFEALVLECMLIKRHQPKYNILLKDGKGYPYLRLDVRERYPRISMVNQVKNDGAEYFGPYGSRGVTSKMLESIYKALKLPLCNHVFPRDVGRIRPCLHFHMNQCRGWCQTCENESNFYTLILQAKQILMGNYQDVAKDCREKMIHAADELNFELAAKLRDQLSALESLGEKQLVTARQHVETDVIGYAQTDTKACFAVLHFVSGNLIDKDFEILNLPETPESAVSTLMKQYYISRGFAPPDILLPFSVDDSELFEQYLLQELGTKVHFKVPIRGEKVKLVALANKNAYEEAVRVTDRDEKYNAVLHQLGKMIGLPALERIEAYDISHISGSDIVAAMIVFKNGRPKRSEYKQFKINNLSDQDDYASMRQVLSRRFTRYLDGDNRFAVAPDLLLIDGGIQHALLAEETLASFGLCWKVLGMVKDDRHRTRALVTAHGEEIRIDTNQSVFSLVGTIQEETHRFAINYHRKLRSKRLRYSQLDNIQGIGVKRKEILLKAFRSISKIRDASVDDLERYIPKDAARSVYAYFHTERE